MLWREGCLFRLHFKAGFSLFSESDLPRFAIIDYYILNHQPAMTFGLAGWWYYFDIKRNWFDLQKKSRVLFALIRCYSSFISKPFFCLHFNPFFHKRSKLRKSTTFVVHSVIQLLLFFADALLVLPLRSGQFGWFSWTPVKKLLSEMAVLQSASHYTSQHLPWNWSYLLIKLIFI